MFFFLGVFVFFVFFVCVSILVGCKRDLEDVFDRF